MNHLIPSAIMFAQLVNLGMAIVAGGNAIVGAGGLNLIVLQLSVCQACILITRLEKSAAAAAAIIVRSIGKHLDEVFLTHHRFYYEPEIFCNGISECFPYDLAWILNRELDLEILIPVRVDLQLSFPDPFGVVLINVFDFKGMLDVEFFQSCQD